jgi:hypothetical protein
MPRPNLPASVVSETQSQALNVALAVSITLATGNVVSVWSGVGPGPGGTVGVGSFLAISSVEEGSGVFARGIVLTLSGFNAALISDVLSDYAQGLPVTVYLVINGTLYPAWVGRTDQPRISVSGTTASISIACENRLVEMNTSASQFRYTSECQNIFHPNDRAFDSVSFISQSQLFWGRIPNAQNIGIPIG